MKRLILAFPKEETIHKIQNMLDGTSFSVVGSCRTCAEAMRIYSEIDNAVLMMSFKLSDGTCDDVYDNLPPHSGIIVLTKAENIEYIRAQDIFTVPLPINRARLAEALETFHAAYIGYGKKPERNEKDKETICRAKLKLIEKYLMTEEQAHRFIQKRSMNTGMKFVDTAKLILSL